MKKSLKSKIEKCQTCGNNLFFNPEYQSLYCNACKTKIDIKSEKGLFKHDLDTSNQLTYHKNEELSNQVKSMQCQNCGASVVLMDYQTSAVCPYCDTNMVACSKEFDGLKPDSVVPFKFGKEKATQIFKEKLQKKWLAPSAFKKSINADEIKAYYFPAFIFDANSLTVYDGELYNLETVKKDDGTTDTKREYFRIRGRKQIQHTNIEIESSSKLSQSELDSVKPYKFDEAFKYSDEFIYGYSLEHYDNSIDEANKQAKDQMKQDIKRKILSEYNYDGVDHLNIYPTFTNEKFSYCILPMYRINFSYKNKTYSNLVNGQTGKLGGKYPKSGAKITMIILLPILAIVLPILLFLLMEFFV